MKHIRKRLEHLWRLRLAGVDGGACGLDWGRPVVLWRRFRDKRETLELLPALIADWTLATIPEREPGVERARIYRAVIVGACAEAG